MWLAFANGKDIRIMDDVELLELPGTTKQELTVSDQLDEGGEVH